METQICIRPVNNTYPHPHHTPRPHTHTIHPHTLLTPPPPLPAPISIPTFPTARPDSKTSLDKTRLLHTYLAAIPSNFPSSLGLSPCAQGQGTREENQARSRTSPAPSHQTVSIACALEPACTGVWSIPSKSTSMVVITRVASRQPEGSWKAGHVNREI